MSILVRVIHQSSLQNIVKKLSRLTPIQSLTIVAKKLDGSHITQGTLKPDNKTGTINEKNKYLIPGRRNRTGLRGCLAITSVNSRILLLTQ